MATKRTHRRIYHWSVTVNSFELEVDAQDWDDALREWLVRAPREYLPPPDAEFVSIRIEHR